MADFNERFVFAATVTNDRGRTICSNLLPFLFLRLRLYLLWLIQIIGNFKHQFDYIKDQKQTIHDQYRRKVKVKRRIFGKELLTTRDNKSITIDTSFGAIRGQLGYLRRNLKSIDQLSKSRWADGVEPQTVSRAFDHQRSSSPATIDVRSAQLQGRWPHRKHQSAACETD